MRNRVDRYDIDSDVDKKFSAVRLTHQEVDWRRIEHGADTFCRLYFVDRASVHFENPLAAGESGRVRRAIHKDPRQTQIIRGQKTRAESVAFILALAKKLRVCGQGGNEAEIIQRLK